jgi:hypothetical protein
MSPGSTCDPTCEPFLDQEGLANHQKRPICRYLSPLPDSNGGPPPYHGTSLATGGNRSQRIWLNLAVFAADRFAADCHRLQPRGSIKAPYVLAGGSALVGVCPLGSTTALSSGCGLTSHLIETSSDAFGELALLKIVISGIAAVVCGGAAAGVANPAATASGRLSGKTQISFGCPGPATEPPCNPGAPSLTPAFRSRSVQPTAAPNRVLGVPSSPTDALASP